MNFNLLGPSTHLKSFNLMDHNYDSISTRGLQSTGAEFPFEVQDKSCTSVLFEILSVYRSLCMLS